MAKRAEHTSLKFTFYLALIAKISLQFIQNCNTVVVQHLCSKLWRHNLTDPTLPRLRFVCLGLVHVLLPLRGTYCMCSCDRKGCNLLFFTLDPYPTFSRAGQSAEHRLQNSPWMPFILIGSSSSRPRAPLIFDAAISSLLNKASRRLRESLAGFEPEASARLSIFVSPQYHTRDCGFVLSPSQHPWE